MHTGFFQKLHQYTSQSCKEMSVIIVLYLVDILLFPVAGLDLKLDSRPAMKFHYTCTFAVSQDQSIVSPLLSMYNPAVPKQDTKLSLKACLLLKKMNTTTCQITSWKIYVQSNETEM